MTRTTRRLGLFSKLLNQLVIAVKISRFRLLMVQFRCFLKFPPPEQLQSCSRHENRCNRSFPAYRNQILLLIIKIITIR